MNATVDFYLIINTGRRNLDTTRDDTRTHMHTNETLCDSKTVAADRCILAEDENILFVYNSTSE